MNEQKFYYSSFCGRLLGSKAREHLILAEMNSLRGKDFFLDVGCAQGHYLKIAQKKCSNVFGLEYDFQNIGQIEDRENFGVVNADAESIPFKSRAFDFVLCSEVLEHILDWKKALGELKRICKSRIVITIPLEKSLFWRAFSKFYGMQTRGHLHKLESADIEKEMHGWVLEKKIFVHSPSRRLNRRICNKISEKKAMYSLLVFVKAKK